MKLTLKIAQNERSLGFLKAMMQECIHNIIHLVDLTAHTDPNVSRKLVFAVVGIDAKKWYQDEVVEWEAGFCDTFG
jgi:hypothetical protein